MAESYYFNILIKGTKKNIKQFVNKFGYDESIEDWEVLCKNQSSTVITGVSYRSLFDILIEDGIAYGIEDDEDYEFDDYDESLEYISLEEISKNHQLDIELFEVAGDYEYKYHLHICNGEYIECEELEFEAFSLESLTFDKKKNEFDFRIYELVKEYEKS